MSLSEALCRQRMENLSPHWPDPVLVTREEFVKEFLQHFGDSAQCFPMQDVDEAVVERAIEIYGEQWGVNTLERLDLTTNIKHVRDIIAEMDGGRHAHKAQPDYDGRSWDTCGQHGCGARLPKLWSQDVRS